MKFIFFFKFFLLFFLCSSFAFSSELGKRKKTEDKENIEPAKKQRLRPKILIGINTGHFRKIKRKRNDIQGKKTGYTPTKKTAYSVNTPLKREALAKVGLKTTPPKKNLLASLNQAAEEFTEYTPIFSSDSNFSSGKFAHIDPMLPESTVLVDCDHEIWSELIEKMVQEISFVSNTEFIFTSMASIINNLEQINTAVYHNKKDKEQVCRHLATLALPVYSKILALNINNLQGEIYLNDCDFFTKDWKSGGEGHVWNILKLSYDQNISYWLIDLINGYFIEISASVYPEQLVIHVLDENHKYSHSRKLSCKSDQGKCEYVRISKEKLQINNRIRNSLYTDQEKVELVLHKTILPLNPPTEKFIIVETKNRSK